MANDRDVLRDPIWQFIGVVVAILAIFIAILTLPSATQGVALVAVVLTSILISVVLTKKFGKFWCLCLILFFLSSAYSGFLSSLTYYKVSFISNNIGLVVEGVLYPKNNFGLSLIIIEYMLIFASFIFFWCVLFKNRDFHYILATVLLLVYCVFISVPYLYVSNFSPVYIIGFPIAFPQTVLGLLTTLTGIPSIFIFLLFPSKRSIKREK